MPEQEIFVINTNITISLVSERVQNDIVREFCARGELRLRCALTDKSSLPMAFAGENF